MASAGQVTSLRMPSGAVHDTQMMAGLTRTAMIFVPSKEGHSHSPAEWTTWEDLEAGANLLFNTVYKLARETALRFYRRLSPSSGALNS